MLVIEGVLRNAAVSPLGTLKLLKLWNKLVPPTVVPPVISKVVPLGVIEVPTEGSAVT
jgi:hypothetical protein